MSMHPDEVGAWIEAERDVERQLARLRAMGIKPPEQLWCSNPRYGCEMYAAQLRDEVRCWILRRRGEELQTYLDAVASPALLDQLDEAEVPDNHLVDGVVPLGLLRLTRELLA